MTVRWFPVALLAVGLAACDESPVSLPEPTSIAATSAELRLTVGDVTTLPAQVLDQNGQPIRGLQPTFVSDNPSVVSVDASGNVRGVSPGTANITSTYGSVTATTKVTVTRNERNFVRTLELSADSVVTDVRGGTQVVSLRAFNGFGQQVCPAVSVQVEDRSVADVAADGNCRIAVTPRFAGRTQVTVSADGVSDTFNVVVSSTGALAFFSARPTPAQLFAGNTVTYSVRVLDEQGNPVANRNVNFDVSAGRLSATRATTNAEGIATVQWVLPTNLRELGNNQSISFSTQLPNGQVVTRTESAFINAAALATITLVRQDIGAPTGYSPITGSSISARTFQTLILGARGEDQFGNPRSTDFTFTVTPPAFKSCGDFQEGNGNEVTCIFSTATGTSTFTATVPASGSTAAVSKSVNVVFTN